MNQLAELGLPLLFVIEGENDICFLKAISKVLHRTDPDLPDLSHERRIVFIPTGGSNLLEWVSRLATLHKREFHLFDREQEPETTNRRQVVDFINTRPSCFAALTSKRTVENYLHPLAIREVCGIDLRFDDDTDMAGLLALKLMERAGQTSWCDLPYKRQRRLHEKAKKILNMKAVQRMTPAAAGRARSWRRGNWLVASHPTDDRIAGTNAYVSHGPRNRYGPGRAEVLPARPDRQRRRTHLCALHGALAADGR